MQQEERTARWKKGKEGGRRMKVAAFHFSHYTSLILRAPLPRPRGRKERENIKWPRRGGRPIEEEHVLHRKHDFAGLPSRIPSHPTRVLLLVVIVIVIFNAVDDTRRS